MIFSGWTLVSARPSELDHERSQDTAGVPAGHQHGPRVPPPRQQGHLQVLHRAGLDRRVRHEVREKPHALLTLSAMGGVLWM